MAVAKPINPFTAQDLALAQALVDSGAQLLDFYSKCTNCGLNVGALVAQVKAQMDFGQAILREFGSGASNV